MPTSLLQLPKNSNSNKYQHYKVTCNLSEKETDYPYTNGTLRVNVWMFSQFFNEMRFLKLRSDKFEAQRWSILCLNIHWCWNFNSLIQMVLFGSAFPMLVLFRILYLPNLLCAKQQPDEFLFLDVMFLKKFPSAPSICEHKSTAEQIIDA